MVSPHVALVWVEGRGIYVVFLVILKKKVRFNHHQPYFQIVAFLKSPYKEKEISHLDDREEWKDDLRGHGPWIYIFLNNNIITIYFGSLNSKKIINLSNFFFFK